MHRLSLLLTETDVETLGRIHGEHGQSQRRRWGERERRGVRAWLLFICITISNLEEARERKKEGDRVTDVGMASSLPAEHTPSVSLANETTCERTSLFVPPSPGRRIPLRAMCLEPQHASQAHLPS